MAGKIRAEDILAVKERTSIEEVVREHVTLTRRGSALVGLCPFHDEKTGSFNVNPHNGFYHCYGCGAGGDVIKFVTEIEHLTFTEAVERLAAKAGVDHFICRFGSLDQFGQVDRFARDVLPVLRAEGTSIVAGR